MHRLRPSMHTFICLVIALLGVAMLLPLAWAMPSTTAPTPSNSNAVPLVAKPDSKLSARLLRLAGSTLQTADAQARVTGLPRRGPASLRFSAEGELLVYIQVSDTSAATLQAAAQRGARAVHVSDDYRTITAFVRPDQLQTLATLPSVHNVREVLQPKSGRYSGVQRSGAMVAQQAVCPTGLVSEGDQAIKADQARRTFNVDGSGVTIGVLSNSYNVTTKTVTTAQADIASGDLPGVNNPCGFTTPVNVLAEYSATDAPGTDEGRAMLQIVHDLAPASSLAFATASNGLFSFADNIRALQQAGADVIVDDETYLNEPVYQDGPVNMAIKDVTNAGTLYFTAAGNDSATDSAGNAISSYEATYQPKSCVRVTYSNNTMARPGMDCQDFDSPDGDSLQSVTVQPNGSFALMLQWSEPWYGVVSDLDLYVVDQNQTLIAASDDRNTGTNGTQQPFEALYYQNSTASPQQIHIIIARYAGAATPRVKYTFVESDGISAVEFNATNSPDVFGPNIFGHSMEASALSIAAVEFNNITAPEPYSSAGPSTLYFGPVAGTTPATTLATPLVRHKPDVAASDGIKTTFFEEKFSGGVYRFFGTSAAAPHAAAVGALMLQQSTKQNQQLNQSQVAQIFATTAAPIQSGTSTSTGAGLINALAALQALTPAAAAPAPSTTVVFLPFVQH